MITFGAFLIFIALVIACINMTKCRLYLAISAVAVGCLGFAIFFQGLKTLACLAVN